MSGSWTGWPGASPCTSQPFPVPVCCTHFNLMVCVHLCTKTIILLHLSLFLFVWEHTSTFQLPFSAPLFYAHIFSFLLLLELKEPSWDSRVTNPQLIPVYNIMTNIFKTPGKKKPTSSHIFQVRQFYFSQVPGFIFHVFSSCFIICPFQFGWVWHLLLSKDKSHGEYIYSIWQKVLKVTQVYDAECGARNQSTNLLNEPQSFINIFKHKMKFHLQVVSCEINDNCICFARINTSPYWTCLPFHLCCME